MTPERWHQVEEVYQLVLQRDASQRAAFLKQACAGDDEMQREIESLLAHQEPANKFMEAPGMVVLAQAMAQDRAGSMIGRQIGAYQILALLGVGGMGEVYQARDTRLGRLVAFKVLPPGMATDPERRRRFLQEAKAASALNHPHIVTLYDVGSSDGIDFLVMEYVSGKTLDKLIPRSGLDLRKALQYGIDIADAFANAHAAGIIHLDLKPGNIMVTREGTIKVLDFGVAKFTAIREAGELVTAPTATATEDMILGTASYMSPEQAEGKKLDTRSDIFSFGALLYEMVTGRRAFQGDSKLSTLSAILRGEPKAAGLVVKALPAEYERIISRCLRKDAARRFQTMADLRATLEELRDEWDSGQLMHPVPRPGPRRWLVWAAVCLIVITLGVGAIWIIRSITKSPEDALHAVPLTTYPGHQVQPSFSPDGNQVAFSWDGEKRENQDIYVKLIGTGGPPLRLTTDRAKDDNPAWSPDGRFIAFLRAISPQNASVVLIPALGGPERKLGEVFTISFMVSCLAWSPDGKSLLLSTRDPPAAPFALFLLSIETGEKRRLTSPPAHLLGDSCPVVSPDGRSLAFVRSADAGIGDLYLMGLSADLHPLGEARRLTLGNRGWGKAAWTPNGKEIIFAGTSGLLWRITPAGSAAPQRLAIFGENIHQRAISPRGRRLAYRHDFSHSNIWRIAVPGPPDRGRLKTPEAGGSATRFISSTRDDSSPQFSPDGKRIAFVSNRSGNDEIWASDEEGSNAAQLTDFGSSGAGVTTPRWSPDGQRIAFDSSAAGEYDIWVVSVSGGKPQRITDHPANDGNPSWSRDGRWIYFDSLRSGAQQVWKVPANGGEAIQVTRDGGYAPLESPDGKMLYYTKALAATSVWKMPVEGGQATKILDGLSAYINLAIVGKGLYFVPEKKSATSSIQFLNFTTGQINPVAEFENPFDLGLGVGGGITVSPDGRWILFTQIEQASSELMLVENFL